MDTVSFCQNLSPTPIIFLGSKQVEKYWIRFVTFHYNESVHYRDPFSQNYIAIEFNFYTQPLIYIYIYKFGLLLKIK